MSEKKYVYPKLSGIDLSFMRIGGPGLANCMFVAARAYVIAQTNHWKLINPTWIKISMGPYIRGEKDKRHYFGLFKKHGVSGIKKCILLIWSKKYREGEVSNRNGLITISGLGNYFVDLLLYHNLLLPYFSSIINPNIIKKVEKTDFRQVIGIHVRLGDYISSLRTPISWYKFMIEQINNKYPNSFEFLIFSDGRDDELCELISIKNVYRVFYGNALADIWALSKCRLIMGSDSTFSGWGAFLGQVPIIFPGCHFGNVLLDTNKQLILNENDIIPESFLKEI